MSDTMLFGILRMPFDLAMSTPTSQLQYHQRGQQAADEIERLRAEIERLRGALEYMINVCPAIDPDGGRAHERAREMLEGKP